MDAYKLAYELLSEKVNFFEIYPKFFISLIKENNTIIYDKLQAINITEDDKDEINKLIEIYLNELDKLRAKSDVISNLVGCKDDLGFFQEMMSDNINVLQSHSLEQLKVLEYISLDDALNLLGLDKEYILKINKKYY